MLTISSSTATAGGKSARTELTVSGMNCGNCVRHVTEALQGVNGVASASVSLETNRATIRWAPGGSEDASLLIQAVKGAGYHATPFEESHQDGAEHTAHKENLWSNNVVLGIAPTVLMMVGEWALRLSDRRWYG